MFHNDNYSVINRLVRKSIKANKIRNTFAVIAIILTTVLITAVFTIGISLSDGMRLMKINASGRSTEVDFQYLTEKERQLVTAHPLVKEYGLSRLISLINDGVFRENHGEIRTADENFARFTFNMPTTGRLPERENEIALSSWILDAMGLPRELGQTVKLDFEVAGTAYDLEFTVCGFVDREINLHPYGYLFISDLLGDKLLQGVDPSQTRQGGGYYGVNYLTANIDGKHSRLEENVDTIVQDTGIDGKASGILFNSVYTDQNSFNSMFRAMAFVILLILVSGCLLIYNIFYISVMRDVRFYGLLKTIGTTRKQLGRIVNFQALLLCGIGIPAGLFIGNLLGIVLIPVLLGFLRIEYMQAFPNPWIFLLGTVTALATVLISCRGPAKKAGRISPIEAVRYTGLAASCAKKIKNGKGGAGLSRMALSNVFRSRKKALLVIASLSVGLILFNIVYTYVGSYDVNKFLEDRIHGDFVIADTDYFNLAQGYQPGHSVKEELLSDIKKLDGVKDIAKVYFADSYVPIEGAVKNGLMDMNRREILKEKPDITKQEIEEIMGRMDFSNYSEFMNTQIFGVDSYWLDKLEENMVEGSFDREKFLTGNYLILGYDGDGMLKVGETVTMSLDGSDGEKRDYEVMGIADHHSLNLISSHYISTPGFTAYVPSSAIENLDNQDIMSATVIAEENSIDSLQTGIGSMLARNPNVEFRSRNDYIAEMKSDNQQMALIGFTLCTVILLIGILNFANTIITNIYSRKHELAMLQSIGMTDVQSKKMLVRESIFYMAITMFLFSTAGYLISYMIVKMLTDGSAAYTYQFSFAPLMICLPVLLILAWVLPLRIYKNISRQSVVKRLQETE